jgi:dUTP pyrophosphatase
MRTVLSKQDILNLIHQKPPLVEQYLKLEDQLQPNGFDLTLREVGQIQTGGQIGVTNAQRTISGFTPLAFDAMENLDLAAGAYIVSFNEIINLPKNIMALGAPRSSLLRCGVTVHMAVWDAGYSGRSQSLMVVYNPQLFRIQRNARLAQLVFFELVGDTEGYQGAYQRENISDQQ